jgi:hypothetical protein
MFGFRNQRESARMAEIVQSRLDALIRQGETVTVASVSADAANLSDDGTDSEYEVVLEEASYAPGSRSPRSASMVVAAAVPQAVQLMRAGDARVRRAHEGASRASGRCVLERPCGPRQVDPTGDAPRCPRRQVYEATVRNEEPVCRLFPRDHFDGDVCDVVIARKRERDEHVRAGLDGLQRAQSHPALADIVDDAAHWRGLTAVHDDVSGETSGHPRE